MNPLPRMEQGPPCAQMIALDDPAKFVLSFKQPVRLRSEGRDHDGTHRA